MRPLCAGVLVATFEVVCACSLAESGLGGSPDAQPEDSGTDATDATVVDAAVDVIEDDSPATPSPASPGELDASPPLVLWVRGDSIGLLDAGPDAGSNAVTSWPDQSPAKHDLLQANTPEQPTWSAQNTNYNNYPTVHFGQYQLLTNGAITLQQPTTVLVVGNAGSNISYFFDSNDLANRLALLTRSGTPGFPVSLYSTGGTYAPISGFGDAAVPAIILSIFNGGSSNLFLSSNVGTGALAVAPTAKAVGFVLGNYAGANYGLQGDIAECAVFDGVLSSSDVGRLNAYASLRYGIPIK